jgi:hypothetical protein
MMNVPENCALEALKAAMPFEHAEQLAADCARQAVQQLDGYNKTYIEQNPWFEGGGFLRFVPMDNQEIERAVRTLSRYYLVLLHRRGLVA